MAIRKLVSLQNVVFNALEDMGIDHTKDSLVYKRWAIWGAREVGSIGNYVHKVKKICSDCNNFKLPEDAVAVKGLILTPSNCSSIADFKKFYWSSLTNQVFSSADPTGSFIIIDNNSGSYSLSSAYNKWYIQNNSISFERCPEFTEIWVYYLGMEEDEDGNYQVSEWTAYAAVDFVMFKYAKRSRFTKDKMSLQDIALLKQEFNQKASNARAEDGEIPPNEREEIVALMNDPFTGVGYISGLNQSY